jgi:thiol:disulfide interchange protein
MGVATSPDDYWSAYDPKRDPGKDLVMAEAAATKAHKRILLEVGGDWCVWCKYLDKFFTDHADARAAREDGFILMKVNMSPQNENHAFLDRFPKIPAYPYLFVLDEEGKMLAGKKTGDMEECCKTYSGAKMKEFLSSWKPQ